MCCVEGEEPVCIPAELHLNAEVFGNVNVDGVAMLYFYKARIHGDVNAGDSDLVVSERTRFDGQVEINFYGTVMGSEFLNGIIFTGCQLYDPCCISIRLQGFFTTYISGVLSGNCQGENCTYPTIRIDITTNSMFDECGSCNCLFLEVLGNAGNGCLQPPA